jgi:hypothetical protein
MMLFADDQILLADTEDSLHENIIQLNTLMELRNMKILSNESKVI